MAECKIGQTVQSSPPHCASCFLPARSASTPPTLRRPRRGKAASVADVAAAEEEDRAPLPRPLLSREPEKAQRTELTSVTRTVTAVFVAFNAMAASMVSEAETEGVAVKSEVEGEQPALDLSKTKVATVASIFGSSEAVKAEPEVDEDEDGDDVRRSRPADTTTTSLQGG